MNRVIIIGSPGSGKSTLARRLREITDLPLYYLDMIYHKEDHSTVTGEEFDKKLSEILEKKSWIIDGNYLRTMERRMEKADTVIWLDYDTEVCIEGIKARIGTKREDMPWIEKELDCEFTAFVKDFSIHARPKIIEILEKNRDKNIHIFNTREESEAFLMTLGK